MKNNTLPLYLFLIVLFSACTQYDEIESIHQTKAITNSKYENIITMATDALNAISNDSRANTQLKVLDVTPWLAKDVYEDRTSMSRSLVILPDTIFYVVNFEDEKGFALVSDNDQLSAVIALVPNCNLHSYDEIDNPGIKLYLELYKESLLNNRINTTHDPNDFIEFIDPDVLLSTSDEEEWTTVTEYPVKLIQNWGQHSPYNKYCFTYNGLQAVAGCLPVALAQTLTYYEYPATINGYSINWSKTKCSTPTTEAEKDAVARLIHEVGVLTNANYGTSSTPASVDAMTTLLTNMGYTYSHEKFNTENTNGEIKMIHNLYEFGPALIYGCSVNSTTGTILSAHEWVIDGALAQRKTIDGSSRLRFLYHCNWGWNGSCNGYFLGTAFNPYNSDKYKFNYNLKATLFITKP